MEKNERITLVTAFFDVGREKLGYQKRENNRYIEYFKFWARIRNRLVVFTTSEFADAIKKVREDLGLGNDTIVIVEDNIWNEEGKLYHAMCRIEKSEQFREIRMRLEDISNKADYDYVMLMKYWCLKRAVEKGYTQGGYTAWIDFGFNHGGKAFSNPEEFDFEWKYPFKDKICLFARKNPGKELGVIKLLSMTDSIMGGIVVCPDRQCGILYDMCKESMWSLVSIDCIDDDQMLLRMAWRRHPERFQVYKSDWFMPLKQCGGGHLSVMESKQETDECRCKIARKVFRKIKGFLVCRKIQYLLRLYGAIKRENC